MSLLLLFLRGGSAVEADLLVFTYTPSDEPDEFAYAAAPDFTYDED